MKNERSSRWGKKPHVLIVGCGDVGMRLLPWLLPRYTVYALTRQAEGAARLRAAGAVPILCDLDQPGHLARLAGLAQRVVHLAPPAAYGMQDTRTRRLVGILPEGARLVYVSTTGVYGDAEGAFFDETRTPQPRSARARRRQDAEAVLRAWAVRRQGQLAIVRVPGIYAADRLPLERLQQQRPALCAEEDVYTNHIHAEDLAHLLYLALLRARPNRVYHAVDDSALKMAEYFDLVARYTGLPCPPRVSRQALVAQLSPLQLSFMEESRRLANRRMKQELRMSLRYPTVQDALSASD